MTIKQRLKKLEQATGGTDEIRYIVTWGKDTVVFNGEEMTREEFDRRYPGKEPDKTIILTWDDDEHI